MKSLIKLRTKALFSIPLVLACFALLPSAQAVVPAPDGGYPGFNTAEGQSALGQAAPGVWNTAIGGFALNADTGGGTGNTAVGLNALRHNSTGDDNIAIGVNAMINTTSASNNVAVGFQALKVNNGASNTAVGFNALVSNTVGVQNTAVGQGALAANGASGNVSVGFQALSSNTSGPENTAVGYQALHAETVTTGSAAFGDFALTNFNGPAPGPTGDGFNTALGSLSMAAATQGAENVAVGRRSLENLLTGSNNTVIGWRAGDNYIGGEFGNIVIGSGVAGVTGDGDTIRIGDNLESTVLGVDRCFIGGIWSQPGGTQAVFVNSAGKLGFFTSSRRFKDEIKPMDQASEVIYALKPVSFRYKAEIEPTRPLTFGLVAEDVDKVNPDLVLHGGDGKPNSVRYECVNAMMLNEFLKEHKKVQELEATVAQQQKGMDALVATVKEQAAQIQKVSAQVEMSKSAPKVVTNDTK